MIFGFMESMIIYAFTTIFSIGLFSISILSYHKSKNQKLLFVSIVFLFFFIKGIFLSLSLFLPYLNTIISTPLCSIFDLLILIVLFMATLKK